MTQFHITGMHCAACSANVEKAVSKLSGVSACSVNLLTEAMSVEGSISPEEIIAAVQKAGYGASLAGGKSKTESPLPDTKKELFLAKGRLLASLFFLLLLMYASMGRNMLRFPLPAVLENNPVGIGILQMLLAVCVMVIQKSFFVNGFGSLLRGAPNMDTLVSLGSAASFGYSVFLVFAMTVNPDRAAVYLHDLYFESAAMILTLISLGKLLETRSKGKTTDAIKDLIRLSPQTVTVLRGDEEIVLPIEKLSVGDLFLVRPGEAIAADGVVEDGGGAVDESAFTGESMPVDKKIGDSVTAATVNLSGVLKCRASKVGEDTALAKIIRTVENAAATKAPIAKIADRVSGIFVPVVTAIAAVTVAIWLLCGQTFGFALARGISVLVISCPCALGLATPVAITVGNGIGAKNGILFKTAAALERAGRIKVVAFDKTGTLTEGKPRVTDILSADGIGEDALLGAAYSLEYNSEHPLARAIVALAKEKDLPLLSVTDFQVHVGNGLTARSGDETVCGGNYTFISDKAHVSSDWHERGEKLAESGKTPLYFCKDDRLLGIIAVADTLKEQSRAAIQALKKMEIHTVMLTGDNEKTAQAIAGELGIDGVAASLLPQDKERVLYDLKKRGLVAMVGDGINDAPALTSADLGIAIGAGTDVAIDAAEAVITNSDPHDVVVALRLGRRVLKTIRQNLFYAFFYNLLCIPLAAGAFIRLFGWQLDPMIGAAAMSLSSFCVVSNALRLYSYPLRPKSKQTKVKKKKEKTMKKTMRIEGMMCAHCEAQVKKTLESLENVESAVVSHTEGCAIVTLRGDISNAILKNAVEARDYKVLSIE